MNTIYREFCEAVIIELEPQWLKMPTADGMATHIVECSAVCDFPQVVGALDGCHFPVSPPEEFANDYYNYKKWYSIILLALVDHRYRSLYVKVGSPGRCHDTFVYVWSGLAQCIEGPLFQTPVVEICKQVIYNKVGLMGLFLLNGFQLFLRLLHNRADSLDAFT
ncbi:hypothetical protein HPB51_008953 [Rhipicephalus microplus]|uniref:DDE Tnp4 domain-containing protein n=1 Tax=Rhipicephalus microplus TaxID=6941 RepID=A0A9J6D5C0_RHIMP|nr:hypothetical protein HPB51_008953 [Rhipicephalus microplus]